MFYVVLLAMIAAFLAMRLYMVLGKRTGHEQALPPKPAADRVPAAALPRTIDAVGDAPARLTDSKADAGLRAIATASPGFDVGEFLEGSKQAYKMILEAYWKGDEETLTWLAEPDVAEAFGDAIKGRAEAGHVLDNRLVTIDRALIESASVAGGIARIAVRFDADVASVTRDKDGQVISGSMTDATETHEIWTFARALKSDDPNWKLAETDEA